MIPILLLFLSMLPNSLPCVRTNPGASPTTAAPTGCCPPLTQTLTSSTFPDGVMTFTYDNDNCRTTVNAVCTSSDPSFGLYAAIVANTDNYLDYGPTTVSFPGTCVDGAWFMGNPALQVMTLECILTNPPT